jgi:hypothetical protein
MARWAARHTGAIAIEVEHHPAPLAAAAELGDLLATEGSAKGRHRIGDAGGVQGDHVEVALHHHGSVVLTDRGCGFIEAKEMLALLEDLSLRRVEILGLAAIEAAATEPITRPWRSLIGTITRPRKRS